jgi:hypothetical protein
MKVTIEGTDFIVAGTISPGVTAFIAGSQKAERFIWDDTSGNSIRTAFGLTLYALDKQQEIAILKAIKTAGMSYWRAEV